MTKTKLMPTSSGNVWVTIQKSQTGYTGFLLNENIMVDGMDEGECLCKMKLIYEQKINEFLIKQLNDVRCSEFSEIVRKADLNFN